MMTFRYLLVMGCVWTPLPGSVPLQLHNGPISFCLSQTTMARMPGAATATRL